MGKGPPRAEPAPAIADGGPSTAWREDVPDGEDAQVAAFIRTVREMQDGFARRGDGRARRGFHVKSHTALRGAFRVLDDLPAAARYGVFKTPRTFPAWVRISNGYSAPLPDWLPDLMGFAVKLEGVTGEPLMAADAGAGAQDFLALNQREIPVDDAREMVVISTATANVLTAPFQVFSELGLARGLEVLGWFAAWALPRVALNSVAGVDFHSLAPIALGPYAVKFKWAARQGGPPASADGGWRNPLRAELAARLRGGELRWDFLAQFWRDPTTTPLDGARAWREADAPFVKLAELTIGSCDLASEAAAADERRLETLSFSPWHGLAEHRPIGNIQRARRLIYEASVKASGRGAG